ncbi:double-strand break repair helicase AddA [Roseicitreum antarcticum]|uniref:DNA 3'-5' helicase n=1 Tax=Roseicitreum antarcticum TaxID=564137 RepID=A0A1H2R186_9RHOB|nr:double-strand break repair helicase AddA [Roseicitreum antarcticum]SDW12900.1 DNA helicase/exodeoxyribonuclease V, subunit A [Roseicitreum antarcticum]
MNEASLRQIQAADPTASTWLSANAGSGKTRVLTDRVARLLLNGTSPQRVLCLTYTKAAASEMQNRLFARLGEWAMLGDAALSAALRDIGHDSDLTGDTLASARRLFARAIETPGGLKIQTIHSFCASLLRRFPLEAGVTPQFTEMDDRTAKRLRADVLEGLTLSHGDVVEGLLRHFTGDSLDELMQGIAKHRDVFAPPLDRNAAMARFGLDPDASAVTLLAQVFLGGEHTLIAQLLPIFRAGTTTDVKAADKLAKLSLTSPELADLTALEGLLLFGATAKAGPFAAKLDSFPTNATRAALGDLMHPLQELMRRVECARPVRLSLAAAAKTAALHRFAGVFLPALEARKTQRGWLDFDDLILRARDLLTDPSVAQWVLFKLDGGVDHILVDEAQDTSPQQWRVIELLTQEFTVGDSARSDDRTIFVVGDKKQSIYSFQGADLGMFETMRTDFAARLDAVGVGLNRTELLHSFRSSDAVLRVVDHCFADHRGTGLGGDVKHIAFQHALPGRVDIWPVVGKTADPEDGAWFNPVDLVGDEHHTSQLARRIAEHIRRLIDTGTCVPQKDGPRAVHEGDFLILLRRRSQLFHEIIRACKVEGLEIAGADVLRLGGEMAVRDLTALLSFLATPEDDLSLAAALRSPLFGWSEDDLFRLAHGRKGFLWEALRDCGQTATREILSDLLNQTDFLRPYDLIERMLTRHDGRRLLLARLGAEAEDGIDAFLTQALEFERGNVPSLTGFLTWLETEEVKVKRQADTAGRRIRVMTVHGAKGLEAPIVILPDTAKQRDRGSDDLVLMEDTMCWTMRSGENPAPLEAAIAAAKAIRDAEDARLLYVAMTRAETWLIVAASGDVGDGKCWYDQAETAARAAGAGVHQFRFGAGLRHAHETWPNTGTRAPDEAADAPPLPDWARTAAPTPVRPAAPLTPSGLGGAKALAGEYATLDSDDAMRRGHQLHMLLEHLPHWADAPADVKLQRGHDLLRAGQEDGGATPDVPSLLAESAAVLEAPELAFLFAPGTLAEVELCADLMGQRLNGTVDRLIVSDERVLAVDYKSNAVIPGSPAAVPNGLLRQMAAYEAALRQIYPDRQVEVALLWTRAARLMRLPSALLSSALTRASLDHG